MYYLLDWWRAVLAQNGHYVDLLGAVTNGHTWVVENNRNPLPFWKMPKIKVPARLPVVLASGTYQ